VNTNVKKLISSALAALTLSGTLGAASAPAQAQHMFPKFFRSSGPGLSLPGRRILVPGPRMMPSAAPTRWSSAQRHHYDRFPFAQPSQTGPGPGLGSSGGWNGLGGAGLTGGGGYGEATCGAIRRPVYDQYRNFVGYKYFPAC
jgi:hypothetical protein